MCFHPFDCGRDIMNIQEKIACDPNCRTVSTEQAAKWTRPTLKPPRGELQLTGSAQGSPSPDPLSVFRSRAPAPGQCLADVTWALHLLHSHYVISVTGAGQFCFLTLKVTKPVQKGKLICSRLHTDPVTSKMENLCQIVTSPKFTLLLTVIL